MLEIKWKIPWKILKGDLVNSFFQKTSLSSSKIGFFIKKMGGWIFWKNELTKSPLRIFQGFFLTQFRAFWHIMDLKRTFLSNVISVLSSKNFSVKNHFVTTNDGTRHVDRVSPSPLTSSPNCCHVSNSSTRLTSSLQKQIPLKKVLWE